MLNFRPLIWRNSHPSVLADRVEDCTPPELLQDATTPRQVVMFGYGERPAALLSPASPVSPLLAPAACLPALPPCGQ